MDSICYQGIADNEDTRWWDRGRRAIADHMIQRYLKLSPSRTVLSAGCGTGGELGMLSRYGAPYGIDPSSEAVAFCGRAGYGDRVKQAPVEHIPFQDNFFDLIAALEVLEHLPDEKPALEEIRRVLKDDGLLAISVPAYQWLWSKSDVREHHFRRYTKKELSSLLRHHGFIIRRITYCNTFLFPAVAGAKILSRIREPKGLSHAEFYLPRPINTILTAIFMAEAYALRFVNMPFGISIMAIAKKDTSGSPLHTAKSA